MKHATKRITVALLLSFSFLMARGQDQPTGHIPRWASDQGYWVVETNKNSPLDHVTRFYNNDDILVYKETVSGKKMNLRRAKVKMQLKKVLESSVIAYQKEKQPTEEMALLKKLR